MSLHLVLPLGFHLDLYLCFHKGLHLGLHLGLDLVIVIDLVLVLDLVLDLVQDLELVLELVLDLILDLVLFLYLYLDLVLVLNLDLNLVLDLDLVLDILLYLRSLLTQIKAKPIIRRPIREANQRPIRCPKGPKRLVPIRYEMEAGKKAAPSCHFSASILSIMKMGKEGSSMAMPILANVIAPRGKRCPY